MSSPKPPDPYATAQTQNQFDVAAAQKTAQLGMTGQQTPYGALAYSADPNSPSGYTATQTLSPQQQALLNLQTGAQTGIGGAAQGLGQNIGGMYGSMPNIDPSTTLNQLIKWNQAYNQPIFQQQRSNLAGQLANQGLTPGSEAYNNALNLQARNEGDVQNQFFAQAEPLAFGQAVQQYQLPLQAESQLLGLAAPQGPNYVSTPQPQVQPPNYQGLVQQNYQNQLAQQQAMMSGLFGIPTSLAGGWALGGFKGLPSFGGIG